MIELYRYLKAMLILKMISWVNPPSGYETPLHLRYTVARWLINRYMLLVYLPVESPVYDKWSPIFDAMRSDELDTYSFNVLKAALECSDRGFTGIREILGRGYFESSSIFEATGDIWVIGHCIKGPCKRGKRYTKYNRFRIDVIGDIVHEDVRYSQELYMVYRITNISDAVLKRAKHLIARERAKKKRGRTRK